MRESHAMEAVLAPSGEEVRRQLDQILSSPLFRRSDRLSRFLRFSVEAALDQDEERVKEYTVGVEVFDRGENFDPRIDPVVRVEARRLRARLKSWYESEGRGASVVIHLPTGSYLAAIRRKEETNGVGTASVAPRCPGEQTIAVLPFSNLNRDPQLDYLSDGLTEELIHSLTRMRGLHVVAWHSMSKLKGADQDISAIGERLNVQNVLRGSLRRAGDRVRVTAQLMDALTGQYLWSEAWDRTLGDLLSIEKEIAGAIVRKLRPESEQRRKPLEAGSVDPAVHDLILKGRFEWNKRTHEGLRLARAYFLRATERAPEWPLAWAALADACAMIGSYGVVRARESMPEARTAAERALALDPECAEAVTCLAAVQSGFDWNWSEAGALYQRAIELNPSYATARQWYADHLALTGDLESAIGEVTIALTLDPLSSIVMDTKAFYLMLCERYDEAEECLLQVLQQDAFFLKSRGSLGRVYAQMGKFQQGIEQLERARAITPDNPSILGILGQTYGFVGRRSEARHILSRLAELATNSFVRPSSFALVHLGLNEKEAALDSLERALQEREASVCWLGVHPVWDPLREEPRFREFLKRMNLQDRILR